MTYVDAALAPLRKTGQIKLYGSDAPPERYQAPRGFALQWDLSDAAEAERVFAMLAEGGVIHVRLEETFWAARFGVVTDRFGIPWVMNCEKKEI